VIPTSEYYRNKVAVVTGGASGIGLALAETLLSYEAKRIVLADINDDNLKREAVRLNSVFPDRTLGIHCDVSKEAEVERMIRQALEFGGQIDILFNNAGAGFGGTFDQQTNKDWENAFALNFYGAVNGIRAVLPIMRRQGCGHIVNTISGIALFPMA
jgi:NAD(P)-dependent dehydrogenase (short-subunit alcohol dehydrogenase family)